MSGSNLPENNRGHPGWLRIALLLISIGLAFGLAFTPGADPVSAARPQAPDRPQEAVWAEVPLTPTVLAPFSAAALPTQTGPVVRGILYWNATCPNCHIVMEEVLPPLQEKYGPRLDIRRIELRTTADLESFYKMAAAYGISEKEAGVPLLLIGNRALLGAAQIPAELPGLIEQYYAAGGVDFPEAATTQGLFSLPESGLCELDESTPCATPTPAPPAPSLRPQGMELAAGVLCLLILALGYTGWMAVRAVRGIPQPSPAGQSPLFLPLILLGIGIAGYLFYIELRGASPVCGPIGDCETVQFSEYARLFGILPIAGIGLAGYLGLLTVGWVARRGPASLQPLAPLGTLAMTLFGTGFSIYLTCLELFVIHAVCVWCLGSAVVMALLLILSAGPGIGSLRPLLALRPARSTAPQP